MTKANGGVQAVKVKTLEFVTTSTDDYMGNFNWRADTAFGSYLIFYYRTIGKYSLECFGRALSSGWHSYAEEAKAAAQADYERRILSAIETIPDWQNKEKLCLECEGEGFTYSGHPNDPHPVETICRACGGSGRAEPVQELGGAAAAKGDIKF